MSSYKEFRAEVRRRKLIKKIKKAVLLGLIVLFLCTFAWLIVWVISLFGDDDSNSADTTSSISESQSEPELEQTPTKKDIETQEEKQAKIDERNKYWEDLNKQAATINTVGFSGSDSKMLAVQENGRVELSYFDRALFMGDSITTGLDIYRNTTGLPNAKVIAEVGAAPVANGAVWARDKDKNNLYDPIESAILSNPDKIYLMFGTNTLVNPSAATEDKLINDYGIMIDKLQERAPNVPIYVQSILATTAKATEKKPGLTKERIASVNNRIAEMAVSKGCYYLNVQEVLCYDNGYLNWDIAQKDGIHIKPEAYRAWLEYLTTHTVHKPENQYVGGSPTALLAAP